MKLPKYNPALLPWVGAASQAVLYSFAGVKAYGDWGWFIGPGVGITASLAVATASTSTSGNMSRFRRTLVTAGIVTMVLVSPAVIALSIAIPESFWTAIAWGMAVDVSIVLAGAVAGNRMVAQSEKPAAESAARPKKSRTSAPEVQEIPAPVAQSVAPVAVVQASATKYPRECGVNGCTYELKNAQSVGGHMKAKHPAALGIFAPQKQEQPK